MLLPLAAVTVIILPQFWPCLYHSGRTAIRYVESLLYSPQLLLRELDLATYLYGLTQDCHLGRSTSLGLYNGQCVVGALEWARKDEAHQNNRFHRRRPTTGKGSATTCVAWGWAATRHWQLLEWAWGCQPRL